MSVDKLMGRVEAHLYAAEAFKDIAEKLPELMKPGSDQERLAVFACRSILIQVGNSEMTVASGLLDVARQQKEAATC